MISPQIRVVEKFSAAGALLPASVTTAVNSGAIDASKYHRVIFDVLVGTIGASATVTAVMQYSTDGGSTWNSVANGQNIGNDTAGSHWWALEVLTDSVYTALSLSSGSKLQLRMQVASATAATPICVVGHGADPRYLPVANEATGWQTPVTSLAGS